MTVKMISTDGFLTAPECNKFVFGLGPCWGAHCGPPDPPVDWWPRLGY